MSPVRINHLTLALSGDLSAEDGQRLVSGIVQRLASAELPGSSDRTIETLRIDQPLDANRQPLESLIEQISAELIRQLALVEG